MLIYFSMFLSSLSVIIPIGLVIVLQIHLSKMNEKWIGLLLPIITGVLATFLLYLSVVSGFTSTTFRLVLFITIYYLPTLILLFIFLKINKDRTTQSKISSIPA
ncbi:MAG TPA: hypothetical protein VFH18_02820 [Erysipelotrichaceae bacterium]|nr:hypothetical protein [Erysipelotrichaceae bacterium]